MTTEALRAYNRAYYQANKAARLELGRKNRRSRRGMKDATGETRGGACEICGCEMPQLDLDHNPTTGAIRGWLCSPCNTGLGKLKDSPTVLRAALAYLEKYGPGRS